MRIAAAGGQREDAPCPCRPRARRRAPRWLSLGASAAIAAVGLTAVSATAVPRSGASTTKNTLTWAEPPASVPDYIFPFVGVPQDSILNLYDFQSLMYRPLYFFGKGNGGVGLNTTLSLAQPPVYSNGNTTVTIVLKTYRWSNGTKVDATDVMFFFNLLHAEKTNYGNFVPDGLAMPTVIKSITVKSPTSLVITFTRALNPNYFTGDQLWEPTPFPLAWTKTSTAGAPGSGGCATAAYGTADAQCKAVYTFLSEQAGYDPTNPNATNNALPTYATNPLWQVVDGPFHLTSYTATGDVTMTANPDYSGPNKPTFKTFVEKPYTTASAEYDALATGQVDVGYLPASDVTAATKSPQRAGPNNPRVAASYNLDPFYSFFISFASYNFKSTGDGGEAGTIFSQLYLRQAMQDLINQPLYISRIGKGYGVPTNGPVPLEPANDYVSALEKSNPYPYDPRKARSLLSSHGWKVVPDGTDTCVRPGAGAHQCGAGIRKGAKLSFDLAYVAGTPAVRAMMTAEKASWSTAGINISLDGASFDTVEGEETPCPHGCAWELADAEGYTATSYPTEPVLFSTGAYTNYGSFSTAKADALIKDTAVSNVKLTTYENYLAKQLPDLWEPHFVTSLTEVRKGLEGVTPQNAVGAITPASWHWSS